LEQSLRRLRTGRVDLFYAHHPDPDTPLLETLMTLDHLVDQGKAMSYGLSTYPAWQTVQALWHCHEHHLLPPACLQVRYNLVARQVEAEILPAARHWGLSVVAFSPLAGGLLTGEAARSRPYIGETRWGGQAFTPSQLVAARALDQLASAWGLPAHGLALAWLLSRPGVTAAIIGAEGPAEVMASVQSLDVAAQLDGAQVAELDLVGATGVIDPPGRTG
jgi:aryl-alcohol dehydrogenase-like predicted oxidoreductase